MAKVVSFDGVSKSYKGELFQKPNTVFTDLSFSVEQGQTLGLIGANGAGKSTCIKLIMGFVRPDSGEITILNRSPQDNFVRKKIGYLPETSKFPPSLSVLDMLRFTATTCGIKKKQYLEKSEEILSDLDLWEVRKKQIRTYSKGMQQRASFATALINDPDILILDEPMSGLDPVGRSRIITLIEELKSQQKTILFCSHILEDVDRLADSVLVLHKGRPCFNGKPGDLVASTDSINLSDAYMSLIKGDKNA